MSVTKHQDMPCCVVSVAAPLASTRQAEDQHELHIRSHLPCHTRFHLWQHWLVHVAPEGCCRALPSTLSAAAYCPPLPSALALAGGLYSGQMPADHQGSPQGQHLASCCKQHPTWRCCQAKHL